MDKRRILIVDDEPGLLRLLALMLTHLGHYEVLTLVLEQA
jgi:CheY-like chemotaxis protein